MLVHPLALAPLMWASPEQKGAALAGQVIETLWGRAKFVVGEDDIMLSRIGDHAFDRDGLLMLTQGITDKMKHHLLGAPLDVYADIPLARHCRITGFDERHVKFEAIMVGSEYRSLPFHTPESHAARIARQAADVLRKSGMHWLSRPILERMRIEDLPGGATQSALGTIGFIGCSGEALRDPSITTCIVPLDGSAPTVEGRGWRIASGYLEIREHLPRAVMASLPGRPAAQVLDHWLLGDATITRSATIKDRTRLNLRGPAGRGSRTGTARLVDGISARLRTEEEKLLPDGRAEWDRQLAENDRERTIQQDYGVLDSHLQFTTGGRPRMPRPTTRRK